ncbi:hypothetical protein AGLY_000012 [Aphis glycines]|uniref:Uncharacterized protein n=1 Tax=Aphis glycines TaxID=307491 RepID=A0A6G0U5S1_APHGL|nr:hypothetical protein AGLY_000012 [Aphis glycines]
MITKINNGIKKIVYVNETGRKYILSNTQMIKKYIECHNDINGFITAFSLQMFFKYIINTFSYFFWIFIGILRMRERLELRSPANTAKSESVDVTRQHLFHQTNLHASTYVNNHSKHTISYPLFVKLSANALTRALRENTEFHDDKYLIVLIVWINKTINKYLIHEQLKAELSSVNYKKKNLYISLYETPTMVGESRKAQALILLCLYTILY